MWQRATGNKRIGELLFLRDRKNEYYFMLVMVLPRCLRAFFFFTLQQGFFKFSNSFLFAICCTSISSIMLPWLVREPRATPKFHEWISIFLEEYKSK